MIVKIVTMEGERFYETDRVIVGGYSGSSAPGDSERSLFLESNHPDGSIQTAFRKTDQVYILNNDGKTIDRLYF